MERTRKPVALFGGVRRISLPGVRGERGVALHREIVSGSQQNETNSEVLTNCTPRGDIGGRAVLSTVLL